MQHDRISNSSWVGLPKKKEKKQKKKKKNIWSLSYTDSHTFDDDNTKSCIHIKDVRIRKWYR